MSNELPNEQSALEQEIERVIERMRDLEPSSDAYARMADQLSKLHTLKVNERPTGISKEVLLSAVVHIAGIVIIVMHERAHVMTSKALNFVTKLR